ncbi:MAG: GNAT family N-acetyltransferase [Acidobacteriota bacterium]|nr:GNAT family N-acetyltransferase [Acidobacteriota bacterium]
MFSYKIDEELELSLPTERDAEEIFAVVRENIEQLKQWMPWVSDDYSIETARDFIKKNLIELAENGSFATAIKLDGKIVGTIGLHHLDSTNKSIQTGYWLAKNEQGKGIATRSCRVLIDYAFDELKLNRVQINCNVDNAKSRAIPERLNFQLEGIHRQVECLNGEFRDWAIYAMLKEDWKK